MPNPMKALFRPYSQVKHVCLVSRCLSLVIYAGLMRVMEGSRAAAPPQSTFLYSMPIFRDTIEETHSHTMRFTQSLYDIH
jgi:hypothetical protein